MLCRGIRGATTVDENSQPAIVAATEELLRALVSANDIFPADIASAIFTVTPDLNAAFPAEAARRMGWTDVPLMDAVEVPVSDGLPHCIRVLVHWNTSRPPEAIRHIYLREAAQLRPDLATPNGNRNGGRNGDRNGQTGSPAPRPDANGQPLFHIPHGATVTYQGEPGAYSQEAIFQYLGNHIQTLPSASFEEIFAAIETGKAAYGLLPVENSQAGSINQAYDLLLDHDLRIAAEVKLRVRHCLLAPPGTTQADIRRVRSHPQALAQCARYLKTRGWEVVPAYDTAGATRELAASREPGAAAIASALAGQTYGLNVLDAGIEDSPYNTTRFFLLGREEPPPAARPTMALRFLCRLGRSLARHERASRVERAAGALGLRQTTGQLPGRGDSARRSLPELWGATLFPGDG